MWTKPVHIKKVFEEKIKNSAPEGAEKNNVLYAGQQLASKIYHVTWFYHFNMNSTNNSGIYYN